MTHRLISILLILTISCKSNTAEWQTLDFGTFKLKTPQGWKEFEQEGIDSYVGGLTNGKDSLYFDYGWYSPDIGNEDPKKHLFGQDTINGLVARIAIPIKAGDGYVRMFMPVNRQDKFSISGYNIYETDTILKIYKSIVFKESDTSKNGLLLMSNFQSYPNRTGRTLFSQNCASCHAVDKTLTGPALSERVEIRDVDWIYTFLTDRKSIGRDTINEELKRKFGLSCSQFPNLTKEDVSSIIGGIKSK
jgi:hypothetical protein